MEIRLPRIFSISRSPRLRRSRPSSITRPEVTRPFALGTRPMSESAVMLLPQPDSPTSASVSFRPSVNPTPRTAGYQVPPMRNSVVRSSTTRAGSALRSLMAEPRIGRIAQAVAEHVEAQHDHEDRQAREHREPGRVQDVLETLADHATPSGRGW